MRWHMWYVVTYLIIEGNHTGEFNQSVIINKGVSIVAGMHDYTLCSQSDSTLICSLVVVHSDM